jgi:protein-disulfide isomerase
MHDLLYANQPEENSDGLSDSQLVDYAVQAGANRDAVQKCIDDQTFKTWVAKVTDQSSKDGVNGTPTAIVNGETLSIQDTMDPSVLQVAIDTAAS